MNMLYRMKDMGFQLSWKLISMGVYGICFREGEKCISPLTRADVIEYMYDRLTVIDEQTDTIIALVCQENDFDSFDKLLKQLASKDKSDSFIQKRKWRACLLKDVLDRMDDDWWDGLSEFMLFWISLMGLPEDCPLTFSDGSKELNQSFYTKENFFAAVEINRAWLAKEIATIVELET